MNKPKLFMGVNFGGFMTKSKKTSSKENICTSCCHTDSTCTCSASASPKTGAKKSKLATKGRK